MPELPEVETVARAISRQCVGQTLRAICPYRSKLRYPIDLSSSLIDTQLTAVRRRAKYLIFEFGANRVLGHLGMTGTYRLVPSDLLHGKHDHLDWVFDDFRLRYTDPRRFGWIRSASDQEMALLEQRLGIEPLSPALTAEALWCICQGREQAIKPVLMNQRLIVGIGNIYASEALYRSGLSPFRSAKSLDRDECHRCVQALRAVLQQAIAAGGSSIKNFTSLDEKPGYFSVHFQVYGRAGAYCHCGAVIQKTYQQGRSSFYCPNCQFVSCPVQ